MNSSGFYPPSSSASTSTSQFFPVYPFPPAPGDEHDEKNSTMYIANNHPYHNSRPTFTPSQESLQSMTALDETQQLPSFQVTHPTPTKAMKFRRKSTDTLSGSTVSSFDPSPIGQAQILPSPGTGTLDVMVEANNVPGLPRSRPRSPEINLDEDESEAERVRLEERQARIREKGRERQRRKRERDKKAKESSSTAGHLPVTSGDVSSRTNSQSLSISVPSSYVVGPPTTSSIGSSLPQSASYFSSSTPNFAFTFPPGSTNVSGNSTPMTLFSPSASTPGLGYSPDTSMNASLFSLGLEGTISNANLEMPAERATKKNTRGGKGKAGSSSAISRKISPTPLLTGLPQQPREAQLSVIKAAKRRKSAPQTDSLVSMSALDSAGHDRNEEEHSPQSAPTWRAKASDGSRPQPRRTASDGIVMKSSWDKERDWGVRSPTPPPIPTLPTEYRQGQSSQVSPSTNTASDAAFISSMQAEVFAARLIFLLKRDEVETAWLRNQIGLNDHDIDDLKSSLQGVYEKWVLEKGMKAMSIETSDGISSTRPSSASMAPSRTHMTQTSVPTSPVTTTSMSPSGFFTPLPSRTSSRRGEKRPTLISPIPESPAASETKIHTRQRSLSSASMKARGLHITSVVPPQAQQWSHPATPVLPQVGLTSLPLDQQSDDTASPVNSSLQTPSTGQGSFPQAEQMASFQAHWRSATDPSGQRTYTTIPHPPETPIRNVIHQNHGGLWQVPSTCPPQHVHAALESPLAVSSHKQPLQMEMPPPPLNSNAGSTSLTTAGHPDGSVQSVSGHQRHYSTPVSSRAQPHGDRSNMAVPYTPETPVPVRGQNHSTNDNGLVSSFPMWYNPNFVPQAVTDGSQHPQVLQSPIVERSHGSTIHSQEQMPDVGMNFAGSGQHGF
uniref:Uncharacterized protein n=1 Tax=Kwoniella dejecticola CBS 10117 TaxID=1296121 RepID=A0A1A6AGX7_9TREE|nr:uncharacterized protein I303_01137 [Kwoniella dejecticola CBS 10117]OBR89311.1 hypothetical protein I303_01137 [Kwoniella dejecticola CBS 10117]